MTAVLVLVGIAVGLPLLAWWVGGRPFWSRLRPGAEADPWRDAMRRYRLTPTETARVEAAVSWGRRLEEERLRAAAVDWARLLLEQQAARRSRQASALRLVVTALAVVALGAGVAWQVSRDEEFPWPVAFYWLVGGVLTYWTASAPKRAIRLNSPAD